MTAVGQASRFAAVLPTAGIGAYRPLPYVPTKVSLLNRQRAPSLGRRSASWWPRCRPSRVPARHCRLTGWRRNRTPT